MEQIWKIWEVMRLIVFRDFWDGRVVANSLYCGIIRWALLSLFADDIPVSP